MNAYQSKVKPHAMDRLRTVSLRLKRGLSMRETLTQRLAALRKTHTAVSSQYHRLTMDPTNTRSVRATADLERQLGELDNSIADFENRKLPDCEAALTETLHAAAPCYREALAGKVSEFLNRFIQIATEFYRSESKAMSIAECTDASSYLKNHLLCRWFDTPLIPTTKWVLLRIDDALKGKLPWPPPPPIDVTPTNPAPDPVEPVALEAAGDRPGRTRRVSSALP